MRNCIKISCVIKGTKEISICKNYCISISSCHGIRWFSGRNQTKCVLLCATLVPTCPCHPTLQEICSIYKMSLCFTSESVRTTLNWNRFNSYDSAHPHVAPRHTSLHTPTCIGENYASIQLPIRLYIRSTCVSALPGCRRQSRNSSSAFTSSSDYTNTTTNEQQRRKKLVEWRVHVIRNYFKENGKRCRSN